MNNKHNSSRRQWLTQSGLGLGLGGLSLGGLGLGKANLNGANLNGASVNEASVNGASLTRAEPQVRFCFNTACLRGQRLPIEQLVSLVAQAGYDGIEVWIDELDRYTEQGGKLSELGQQIKEAGLQVEGAIAFANWLVPDEASAAAEFDKARRDMEKVAAIGGRAIAAPPVTFVQSP